MNRMFKFIKKLVTFLSIICLLCGCSDDKLKTNYDIIKLFETKYDEKNVFNKFNIIDLSADKDNYKVAIMQGIDSAQFILIYKKNNNYFYELYSDYRGYTQSYIIYLKKENKTIVVFNRNVDYNDMTIYWKNYQNTLKLNTNEEFSVFLFKNTNKIINIKSNKNDILYNFLEIKI